MYSELPPSHTADISSSIANDARPDSAREQLVSSTEQPHPHVSSGLALLRMDSSVAPQLLTRASAETEPDTSELPHTLALLHAPLDLEPSAWRAEISRSLRKLMGADAVACLFWERGRVATFTEGVAPSIVGEYLEHYRDVDYGMRRRDALGLGLWNRQMLWKRETLLQSEYFNDFARPHGIHDTVGLSVDLDDVPAHLRIVLAYARMPCWSGDAERCLAPLLPVLPALRAGLRMQVGFCEWLSLTSSLLDKVGERLMLFSLEGRELYRSARMRRTLEEDTARERLLESMQLAARSVASVAANTPPVLLAELHRLEATRQDVQGGTGRYRARACVLGPNVVGPQTVVLVSLHRVGAELPRRDLLQSRYGLTPREIEVTRLLVQRMSNREIAAQLGISAHTARHHTESVLLKTHVNSRRALRRLLTSEP
jgi:DNA-binding CsgD family transcriptional regulator